jgi:hypothetical protein
LTCPRGIDCKPQFTDQDVLVRLAEVFCYNDK